jgi:hypothetical protein
MAIKLDFIDRSSYFFIQVALKLECKGVLTIVYDTHNSVLQNRTLQNLDMFHSIEERETPALLGPVERSNLSHWLIKLNER